MKRLICGDFDGMTEKEVKSHIIFHYGENDFPVKDFRIIVAYETVGDFGCDSSSFFLLKKGKKYYENHASHCSCYGFEGQWKPEHTTLTYLKSDHFYCTNVDIIKLFIKENL